VNATTLAHADPLIERWARANLALGFSLQDAAAALSVTPRTLQRRTEAVLGKSPLAFFQDMRVERAQHLISIGGDLERIAGEVGYADSATLRNLLRRRLGRAVRELRAECAASVPLPPFVRLVDEALSHSAWRHPERSEGFILFGIDPSLRSG
jgi:transcriptional regulator GlxA family with amidase domain